MYLKDGAFVRNVPSFDYGDNGCCRRSCDRQPAAGARQDAYDGDCNQCLVFDDVVVSEILSKPIPASICAIGRTGIRSLSKESDPANAIPTTCVAMIAHNNAAITGICFLRIQKNNIASPKTMVMKYVNDKGKAIK